MLKGYVEIEKLRLFCNHGVFPQERAVGNMFEFTLTLGYDMEQAALTDDIGSALNYAEVVDTVREVAAHPSALLENLAWRIREAITERFPAVSEGKIKVAKLTPPVAAQLSEVSVTIQF